MAEAFGYGVQRWLGELALALRQENREIAAAVAELQFLTIS